MDEHRGGDRKQYASNEGRQGYGKGHDISSRLSVTPVGIDQNSESLFGSGNDEKLQYPGRLTGVAWWCTMPLIHGPDSTRQMCPVFLRSDDLRYVFSAPPPLVAALRAAAAVTELVVVI
jgi:hypothetical protein